jgi:hypothetical protein
MRIAKGNSVKVNAEIPKDVDQIIKDYQATKAKRFGEKVSKNDACSDILKMGISEAVIKTNIWNAEIKDLETQIENFKNQK